MNQVSQRPDSIGLLVALLVFQVGPSRIDNFREHPPRFFCPRKEPNKSDLNSSKGMHPSVQRLFTWREEDPSTWEIVRDNRSWKNLTLGLLVGISVRVVPKCRRFEKKLKMAGDKQTYHLGLSTLLNCWH